MKLTIQGKDIQIVEDPSVPPGKLVCLNIRKFVESLSRPPEPCPKHRRYQAKRKPRSRCRACWQRWWWTDAHRFFSAVLRPES